MTLLCGGLHNEARVPEFRLPGTKRVMKDSFRKLFPSRRLSRTFLLKEPESRETINTRYPGGEACAAPGFLLTDSVLIAQV